MREGGVTSLGWEFEFWSRPPPTSLPGVATWKLVMSRAAWAFTASSGIWKRM